MSREQRQKNARRVEDRKWLGIYDLALTHRNVDTCPHGLLDGPCPYCIEIINREAERLAASSSLPGVYSHGECFI